MAHLSLSAIRLDGRRRFKGSSPVYQPFDLLWHSARNRNWTPEDTRKTIMFGQSHSHRVWRMMSALIDAKPEWADQATFEADRVKMLQYGISRGMTEEELFRITDPDVIFGLWTAAEAKGAQD